MRPTGSPPLIHLVGSRKASGHDEGAAEVKVVEQGNGADLVRVINARLPIDGLKQHEAPASLAATSGSLEMATKSLDGASI